MRIDIIDEAGKPVTIRVPTELLLNRFTAVLVPRLAAKYGRTVTVEQAQSFIKAIHECRKMQGDWKLVEVISADGQSVEITL